MQLAVLLQALDGSDCAFLYFKRQCEARKHRHTIEQHGTGAALPQFTAMLGANQAHIFTQHLEERMMRQNRYFTALVIYVQRNQLTHADLLSLTNLKLAPPVYYTRLSCLASGFTIVNFLFFSKNRIIKREWFVKPR